VYKWGNELDNYNMCMTKFPEVHNGPTYTLRYFEDQETMFSFVCTGAAT
jgi:hypothetical protein